jgi:hypothetical protein
MQFLFCAARAQKTPDLPPMLFYIIHDMFLKASRLIKTLVGATELFYDDFRQKREQKRL